jgi:hypothetical protein
MWTYFSANGMMSTKKRQALSSMKKSLPKLRHTVCSVLNINKMRGGAVFHCQREWSRISGCSGTSGCSSGQWKFCTHYRLYYDVKIEKNET